MKIKFNKKYFYLFIILFLTEVIIACFINDSFIRPFVGDVLVVLLIYSFFSSFIYLKYLPLYVFIFAIAIETAQYFNFVEKVGLSQYKLLRIVLGTTFDIKDILAYFVGFIIILLFEYSKNKLFKNYK